jgi:hypothetical protein
LDLAYPGIDSSLLELKVLIPLWTRTPSQFGLVTSIFFLSSLGQLIRITFTISTYPISFLNLTRTAYLNFIRAPYPIASMLTRPYTFIPSRIILPDLFPIELLPTQSYPPTVPNFLTRLGNNSLHPTAYPALPNHLARPGTLQLASPKNVIISLPP